MACPSPGAETAGCKAPRNVTRAHENSDGDYGGCSTHCRYLGCGDGIVNGPEECDLGFARNTAVYGDSAGCRASCTRSHYCGDGYVDADYGEHCDNGALNGTSTLHVVLPRLSSLARREKPPTADCPRPARLPAPVRKRRIRFVKVPGLAVRVLLPALAAVAACDGAGLPESADGASSTSLSASVGSPCDVLTDAGPSQGVYNAEALQCPSRICLKPVVQSGAGTVDTAAFCSVSCSQDSDCDGQVRDPSNPLDTRCQKGFVCGIPFVKGRLCCQKLCLCQDFLGPQGAPVPIACQGDLAATCNE